TSMPAACACCTGRQASLAHSSASRRTCSAWRTSAAACLGLTRGRRGGGRGGGGGGGGGALTGCRKEEERPGNPGAARPAGESAEAPAVPTGFSAASVPEAGGGHQRVGRKRSPAQSNHRAEHRNSTHQKRNGHRHQTRRRG